MADDRFVLIDDANLHYVDWGGEGPLLLLVPGVTATAHQFGELAPRLTDRFRVIALTRRGHGPSDPPPPSFDVDLNVDDLAAAIEIFADGPAVVAGLSHGGIEIARLAGRYPGRVSALIFLDAVYEWRRLKDFPPLPGGTPPLTFSSQEEAEEWHRTAYEEFWGDAFRRHLQSQLYRDSDGVVKWQLSFTGAALRRYLELWDEWMPSYYDGIQVPVLSIQTSQGEFLEANLRRRGLTAADVEAAWDYARYDDDVKRQGLEFLTAAVPATRNALLEETHHFVVFHRPTEVLQIMDDFLKDELGG